MKLIDNYSPFDYKDTFSKEIGSSDNLNADTLFERIFCDFPKPVKWLFKLRNILFKPFGIKPGDGTFNKLVTAKTDEEVILSKCDSHLNFWVGIYCSIPENNIQTASITTVVKFNNFIGKLYFAFIWVFHKLLVSYLFNRAVKQF